MKNFYLHGLLTALLVFVSASHAQTLPVQLRIVVVTGEGATNDIRTHAVVEPVVRVEDEKQQPISGAAVVFTLPTEGATGEFRNGSKTLLAMTDQQGQAAAAGMKVYDAPGKLPIHVTVSYKGLTAKTLITEINDGPPPAPGKAFRSSHHGNGKLIAILAVIGAGAAGGAVAASHKGGSTPASTTQTATVPAPIGITLGTGTISPPH